MKCGELGVMLCVAGLCQVLCGEMNEKGCGCRELGVDAVWEVVLYRYLLYQGCVCTRGGVVYVES